MDAVVFGRFRVQIEDSGLVLTHPSKISFDLTHDEALQLLDILKGNETLLASLLDHAPSAQEEHAGSTTSYS